MLSATGNERRDARMVPIVTATDHGTELLTREFANLTINQQSQPRQPEPPTLNKYNIVSEFNRYFGDMSKIQNWQRLCEDIGLDVAGLTSMTKCRHALSRVWINIYDFIDARREGKIPRRFKSEKKLAAYTLKTGKIYPKNKAKNEGPVKALLAHISFV